MGKNEKKTCGQKRRKRRGKDFIAGHKLVDALSLAGWVGDSLRRVGHSCRVYEEPSRGCSAGERKTVATSRKVVEKKKKKKNKQSKQ